MAAIASIEEAIEDIRAGRIIILVDDEDRENEGDLVVAAEAVTAELISLMVEHGRGLICLALEPSIVDRLDLQPMAQSNQAPLSTAFTVSIDAVDCAGSGVSARERAHTIRHAVLQTSTAADFRVPGHVFPLRAREGGVLVRAGQTEGSVDLARLAGLTPAAVICELMAPDGSMRRFDSILDFGKRHGIRVVTVADLIEHRVHCEPLVVAEAASKLPTRWGEFDLTVFRSLVDDAVHLAMTIGEMDAEVPTLVRVHRSNMLSDAFEFALSRSRHNLDSALQTIADEGRGALIHLESGQTAESMANVLDGYVERSQGRPWPPKAAIKPKMDFREFGVGAQILRHLGLGKLRVLTNQPMRLRGVSGFGLEIVEWLPVGKATTGDRSMGATS